MSVGTIVCPACDEEVLEDEVFGERECPVCDAPLSDLYRLAAGLPPRSRRSGFLERHGDRGSEA